MRTAQALPYGVDTQAAPRPTRPKHSLTPSTLISQRGRGVAAGLWGRNGVEATHLDGVLLVGDEVDTGLHSGVGPFPQHLLLQLVHIWGEGRGVPVTMGSP